MFKRRRQQNHKAKYDARLGAPLAKHPAIHHLRRAVGLMACLWQAGLGLIAAFADMNKYPRRDGRLGASTGKSIGI
ncbi:hypothetical protein [Aquitalea sp. ASV11]|uniref:hypothetical protein n=1 Tax=Aquitalea sp. ASV11 TaxID=2795103 RepID=UPI0018EB6591|nr:hypothetical protein [Aquitalea sp. ASV11]